MLYFLAGLQNISEDLYEAANIINGLSETEFGASAPLSRCDMAVIIFRKAKIMPANWQTEVYADDRQIPGYARNAVYGLSENGILNGMEDGSFAPYRSCTRAEAVKVLSMLPKK